MVNPEFEKFDATVRQVLSVSHDELKRREKAWKRKRAKKKRSKTSPASRVSESKA
jgi:U3 small nucleolar ribonucleoprotein component